MADMVAQRPHAADRGDPARLEVEIVLERHGHAVERAQRRAGHQPLLGLAGLAPRILEAEIDQGIEAGIARLDARDEGVDHLDRRQLAAADAQRQAGGAVIGQFVG